MKNKKTVYELTAKIIVQKFLKEKSTDTNC